MRVALGHALVYGRAVHRDVVVDQFTRQAVPFATAPAIRNEEALRLLVESAGAGAEDTVLDVACGPGLVVCAFAGRVRHATGIDVTPAMLEQARALARQQGLTNVDWRLGDVLPLPYAHGTFSIVSSRFAFHHFPDPAAVLGEMRRVCRPGGRVVVTDLLASSDPRRAEAFHQMEILRDPSHARALTLDDLHALYAHAGLGEPRRTFYDLDVDLDGVLRRSFPAPEDVPRIRAAFEASLADDGMGLRTRRSDGKIHFTYAVAILVTDVPSA